MTEPAPDTSTSAENPKGTAPSPMPRDEQGWRVAPAPDGRGMPEQHKPTPPHRMRAFWVLLAVLLAINWIFVLAFQPSGEPRVKVPFSPYFLQQLDAGKVKSISSKGDTIQGTFTTKLRYPASDSKATPTTLFSTEVPTFWNDNQLTELLQSKNVEVNAQSTSNRAPRCWRSCCSASVRRCCSSACSCCSRGAPPRAAGWARSATSAAHRRGGSTPRRSGSRSTTSPASTRQRPS